jgi:hypothetical protein
MPTSSLPDVLVIRSARPDDAADLARLAALDSRRPLRGSVMVATRDGRVMAAMSTDDGRTIADPFAPTADLVALLRLHAGGTARPRRRRRIARRAVVQALRPAAARV